MGKIRVFENEKLVEKLLEHFNYNQEWQVFHGSIITKEYYSFKVSSSEVIIFKYEAKDQKVIWKERIPDWFHEKIKRKKIEEEERRAQNEKEKERIKQRIKEIKTWLSEWEPRIVNIRRIKENLERLLTWKTYTHEIKGRVYDYSSAYKTKLTLRYKLVKDSETGKKYFLYVLGHTDWKMYDLRPIRNPYDDEDPMWDYREVFTEIISSWGVLLPEEEEKKLLTELQNLKEIIEKYDSLTWELTYKL